MSKNLVLVVDDDPAILRGVQRLLRQHAYEAVVFSSAEAFKSHTDFDRAACVILDIDLLHEHPADTELARILRVLLALLWFFSTACMISRANIKTSISNARNKMAG